jgi:hypothetical protein
MIGDAQLAHRPAIAHYPEDEKVLPCWKLEGEERLWFQGVLVPVARTTLALQMAGWMAGFGYVPLVAQGRETSVLVYIHQAFDVKLIRALAEPRALR